MPLPTYTPTLTPAASATPTPNGAATVQAVATERAAATPDGPGRLHHHAVPYANIAADAHVHARPDRRSSARAARLGRLSRQQVTCLLLPLQWQHRMTQQQRLY